MLNHFLFKNLNLHSQINYKKTSRINNNKKITDLYHITNKISCKINNQILINYLNIEKLSLEENQNSLDLKPFTKLQKLNLSGDKCLISENHINHLNLTFLKCISNYDLQSFKYFTNLRILIINAAFTKNSSFLPESLVALHINNQHTISDLNNLTNLKILSATNTCNLYSSSLVKLDLNYLNICNNTKIININFLTNLRILNASDKCLVELTPSLSKLIKLDLSYNHYKKNILYLTSLKFLNICGLVSPYCETDLVNLELISLKIKDNLNISDINFMTSLKKLDISHRCTKIKGNGFMNLCLDELNCSYNYDIKKIFNLEKIKLIRIDEDFYTENKKLFNQIVEIKKKKQKNKDCFCKLY